jgi:hypothetical protein
VFAQKMTSGDFRAALKRFDDYAPSITIQPQKNVKCRLVDGQEDSRMAYCRVHVQAFLLDCAFISSPVCLPTQVRLSEGARIDNLPNSVLLG